MTDYTEYTEAELRAAAQGCTELTCLYHGQINFELRRRADVEDRSARDRGRR